MNKSELLENYTAEQLAEMVVGLQETLRLKIGKCEVSEDDDVIKAKCDKCGEEFIALLDNKHVLCTKAELFATREANKQLNRDVAKLKYEASKYQKSFEDAKKERDCRIAEYQKKIEELENHHKFSMMQIDDVLMEFLGVTHEVMDRPCDFEKVLQKTIDNSKTIADFLPTEPIKVADMLISAEGEYEHNPLAKALYKEDKGTYRIFDISELRQIAEHLLIYCNANGGEK